MADPQHLPSPQGPQPLSDLARFFANFDPYQDEHPPALPVPEIRLRSAPWDILSDDASSLQDDDHINVSPDYEDHDSIQDSVWVNLLARTRDRPSHYVPTDIVPVPVHSPLADTSDQ
jgi:hypothetical protein